MPKSRRASAAAALLLAALATAGTAALAQEASNTVGPAQLKDFQLPGQRTTPPATTPTPTPTPPPPPAATTPPPQRGPEPAPAAPRRAEPAVTGRTQPQIAAPRPPVTLPTEPGTGLSAARTDDALSAETNVAAPPPALVLPEPQAAPPLATNPEHEGGWLLPAAGIGAVLLTAGLALAALMRRRRRREDRVVERVQDGPREDLGGALFAGAPVPEPEPPPAPSPEPEVAAAVAAASEERRAWLEIDIKPERAAATDQETSVQYALLIRNRGNAIARNIRIDAKLFNASAEDDVTAFFRGPIHEQSGSPHVTIAPEGRLTLMGQVAMPKAEAQEIEMAGLRIFVPMVAINVAYDWKDGSGRTSRSWIVGRESQATDKMGPFRLDLGPRIYRSVGRREAKLAMV
jgi:hypothetical protein